MVGSRVTSIDLLQFKLHDFPNSKSSSTHNGVNLNLRHGYAVAMTNYSSDALQYVFTDPSF